MNGDNVPEDADSNERKTEEVVEGIQAQEDSTNHGAEGLEISKQPSGEEDVAMPIETVLMVDNLPMVNVETSPMQDKHDADDLVLNEGEEPHTSFLQIPHSDKHQYTTPSKSLPPLKDIDQITTPKQFRVAKDAIEEDMRVVPDVRSSPVKDILDNEIDDDALKNINEDSIKAVAGYLSTTESSIRDIISNNHEMFKMLLAKSTEFQGIMSQNEFFKLQLEQLSDKSGKHVEALQEKFAEADNLSTALRQEKEALSSTCKLQENRIKELEDLNSSLRNQCDRLKESSETVNKELEKLKEIQNHQEVQFQQQVNQLSSTNIEQSRKLNELIKEVNDTRNDKFSLQLQLQKSENERAYLRDQKEWYSNELKQAQARFTELIKRHETEYFTANSKISKLSARNESLEKSEKKSQETISNLTAKLEQEITKNSKYRTDFELEKSRFLKELSAKEELIELTKLQSDQREARVQQLETYSDEIKATFTDQISCLEAKLTEKTEIVTELEERLKRTEEVLDAELHKETELPKLTDSSSLIAANGISLSKLYSEYNHLKKQLVSERSQKQKMALQLEQFVNEFEAKKPALANYRDQIKFYEESLKEMIGKVETIRTEKAEVEKDAKRLRKRIVEDENEMVSMKKLLNDLGRQLCFYLIHSKIRDNNGEPLTVSEKNAIEKILANTGNLDDTMDTDSDRLISERLVEFRNIIELRQKNQELLVTIRQLSKKLENNEEENNSLETVAIEEAKDAILTLEREVDSLTLRLDAVTKERDALKTINDQPTSANAEVKYLTKVNEDLRKKISDSDNIMKNLREQSSKTIQDLNEKLRDVNDTKNDLSLKLSMAQKSVELAESRLTNCQRSLDDSRQEVIQVRKEIDFWQQQTTKQESLLVSKSQELRDLESVVSRNTVVINTLEREKEFVSTVQKSLQSEIDSLKNDKIKLNEFVLNLQSLLKDREESSKELSGKLNSSIENYQILQGKLAEKEERIQILCSQSELSLKAQNAKLEQVNEISRQLLETRNKLAEKERLVEELKRKVESSSKTSSLVLLQQASVPVSGSETSATSQGFEITQLKEDLRNAEAQVEELGNLAKASETALINATNSFEQYKIDADAKYQALIKEKQYVEEEVSRLKELCDATTEELRTAKMTHMEESNELKLKLGEYKLKADEYDNLDRDYQNKIASLQKDLELQGQLYNDVQSKFQLEMNKNSKLMEELDLLKNELETKGNKINDLDKELNTAKEELLIRQETLAAEKSLLETELSISNNKVAELKEQNELLLNQIELTKSPANINEKEGENFSQVIHYLRHEKEASDAKLLVATQENQQLRVKLEQLQNDLSIARSALSNADTINLDTNMKESEEVSSRLEQLSILRESNITLRQENSKKGEEIQKLTKQTEALNEELAMVKSRVNELSDQVDIKEQMVALVKEENEYLKSMSGESGETGDQKEAAEVTRLKEKLKDLTSQANGRLQAQNVRIGALQDELEALKKKKSEESPAAASAHTKEIELLKQEIEKAKDEVTKSKQEVEELAKKLKVAKDEASTYISEKNNLVIQLNKRQAELKEQFTKEKEELRKLLEAEFEKKATEPASDALEKKTKELRESLGQELEKTYQEKLTSLSRKHEEELAKLKAQHEQDLAVKDKMNEAKIRMLNKKLEREEKASAAPSTTPSNSIAATTNKPVTSMGKTSFGQPVQTSGFGQATTGVQLGSSGFGQKTATPSAGGFGQNQPFGFAQNANLNAPGITGIPPFGQKPGTTSGMPVFGQKHAPAAMASVTPKQGSGVASTPASGSTTPKPTVAPKPSGYPFTESTLTVHHPTVAKPEAKKFSPAPTTAPQDKKRPNQGAHQHQPIKKLKDA